jgi:hypothetical protein
VQKYFAVLTIILISLVIILLLSGGTSGSLANDASITQQESIEIAVGIASVSIPEFGGSQIAPSNIRAEKMTLAEAAERLHSGSQNTFSEESPDMQVWLVSMDGIWLPPDVPGVHQKPYRHLSIVMDANAGLEIFRNAQP